MLEKLPATTAQDRVKGLLSVQGVLDAVVIESEGVAYLKVDEERFTEIA